MHPRRLYLYYVLSHNFLWSMWIFLRKHFISLDQRSWLFFTQLQRTYSLCWGMMIILDFIPKEKGCDHPWAVNFVKLMNHQKKFSPTLSDLDPRKSDVKMNVFSKSTMVLSWRAHEILDFEYVKTFSDGRRFPDIYQFLSSKKHAFQLTFTEQHCLK